MPASTNSNIPVLPPLTTLLSTTTQSILPSNTSNDNSTSHNKLNHVTTSVYTLNKPAQSVATPPYHTSDAVPLTDGTTATGDSPSDELYKSLERIVGNKHAAYTQREDNLLYELVQQCNGCKWNEIDTLWKQHVYSDIQNILADNNHGHVEMDVNSNTNHNNTTTTTINNSSTTNAIKHQVYPRTSAALRSRWRVLRKLQAEQSKLHQNHHGNDANTILPGSNDINNSVIDAAKLINNTTTTTNNNNNSSSAATSTTQSTLTQPFHPAPAPASYHTLTDGRIVRKRNRAATQRDKMTPNDQKLFAVIAQNYINKKNMTLNAVECAKSCNQYNRLHKYQLTNFACSNAWPKYRGWLDKLTVEEQEKTLDEAKNDGIDDSSNNNDNNTSTPANTISSNTVVKNEADKQNELPLPVLAPLPS